MQAFVVCVLLPYNEKIFGAPRNLTLTVSSTLGATEAASTLFIKNKLNLLQVGAHSHNPRR